MIGSDGRLLFLRAVPAWLLGFLLSGLSEAEWLWLHPVSPPWFPPGPLRYATHALCGEVPEPVVVLVLALALALAGWQLIARPRWWAWALIWFLFTNLMNRAWLSGSGGQQLMSNALFWGVFLAAGSERLRFIGLWAIRLQLLLAYAATGLHKLTGAHWIDGTALGIAATDQAFGPAWLASFPLLCTLATWMILAFQLTFPLAIWFRRLRLLWLIGGALFHLATTVWMDIPEMGLAFIACYPIWCDGSVAKQAALLREPKPGEGRVI